jgi:hypothetical protein
VYKDADLMDFINAPIGKGLPIKQTLRPLIAVPTTAGTGSETTGTAILDITSRAFKTGIANRALKPVLGVVVCDVFLAFDRTHDNPEILSLSVRRTSTTLRAVPPLFKSAPVLMFSSIVSKVIPRSRKWVYCVVYIL